MTRSSGSKPAPPPPAWPGGKTPPRALQRAAAEAVFAPHARMLRGAGPSQVVAEELVAQPGGGYQIRSAERHTLWSPTGTFNFVRVYGEAPHSRPLLVSAKLAHAQMSGGRPVVYAGTARFERGQMAWWSNYSGTYQPIAAFRAQAELPEEKFVPWQKLQMGGTAMQRAVFTDRRAAGPPVTPPGGAGAAAGDGPVTEFGVSRRLPDTEVAGGSGSHIAAGAGQTAKSAPVRGGSRAPG